MTSVGAVYVVVEGISRELEPVLPEPCHDADSIAVPRLRDVPRPAQTGRGRRTGRNYRAEIMRWAVNLEERGLRVSLHAISKEMGVPQSTLAPYWRGLVADDLWRWPITGRPVGSGRSKRR